MEKQESHSDSDRLQIAQTYGREKVEKFRERERERERHLAVKESEPARQGPKTEA